MAITMTPDLTALDLLKQMQSFDVISAKEMNCFSKGSVT